MKQRLRGVITGCMRCGEKHAKWVMLGCFFYCDDCIKEVDK